MPSVPSSFLFPVAMTGAPSSVLAPSAYGLYNVAVAYRSESSTKVFHGAFAQYIWYHPATVTESQTNKQTNNQQTNKQTNTKKSLQNALGKHPGKACIIVAK